MSTGDREAEQVAHDGWAAGVRQDGGRSRYTVTHGFRPDSALTTCCDRPWVSLPDGEGPAAPGERETCPGPQQVVTLPVMPTVEQEAAAVWGLEPGRMYYVGLTGADTDRLLRYDRTTVALWGSPAATVVHWFTERHVMPEALSPWRVAGSALAVVRPQ
jgi:hypothetical protein